MNDDQFTKLFVYVQKEFTRLNNKLDQKTDKEYVYSALDSILKQLETQDQERLMLHRQVGRHEGWIKQLAAKTQTRLAH